MAAPHKPTLQRVAEAAELYRQLGERGLLQDGALRGFRADANAFVRDGARAHGSARLPDGRTARWSFPRSEPAYVTVTKS